MNWYDMLRSKMKQNNEEFAKIKCTRTPKELKEFFDDEKLVSWCGIPSRPFVAWTKDHVYFSDYDYGHECVRSVPRNPTKIKEIK